MVESLAFTVEATVQEPHCNITTTFSTPFFKQLLMGIKQQLSSSVLQDVKKTGTMSRCSVAYLYTHLNWAKVDLEDVWLSNVIWPSRANLTENGNRSRDLIGSSLLIRGCEQIVLYCPWQTVGLLWWKGLFHHYKPLPFSFTIPFSPPPSLPPPPLLPFHPTPLISSLTKPFTLAVPLPTFLPFVLLSFCSWSDYTAGWTSLFFLLF